MTDTQAVVFEALSRGRLVFPFRDEMAALRKTREAGPLTDDESERLRVLEGAFERIKAKDQWFHSAMQAGDIEAARHVAEAALAIMKEVAP